MTLHNRISLLVAALTGTILLLAAMAWSGSTREAIHEEVESATRVAEQWLTVLTQEADASADTARLLHQLQAVGRLRANVLEIHDSQGQLRYRSPEPSYKSGRYAPAWFAALITPQLPPRMLAAGELHLALRPDPSRAVLDAWEKLVSMAGWGLALLLALAFAVRQALHRALAPLDSLETALQHSAAGHFDTRLPRHGVTELDRLADGYNRMVEELAQTLHANARLEQDQHFIRAVNARLEDERRALARELHDEFGQGMTALRAIAGAIAQRTLEQPALHGSAQALLALSSQLQDGVRAILHRLREREQQREVGALHEAVAAYCRHWADLYPQLALDTRLAPVSVALPEDYCLTVLRLIQEGLTNVARHADAHQVAVQLAPDAAGLQLSIRDDGRGFDPAAATDRLGLTGMRERVGAWGGEIEFQCPAPGGTLLHARLPWPAGHAPAFPSA